MDTNHISKFCFLTLPKATRSSGAIFNRKQFHQLFATAENEFSSFLTLINSWWDVHYLIPETHILEFFLQCPNYNCHLPCQSPFSKLCYSNKHILCPDFSGIAQ